MGLSGTSVEDAEMLCGGRAEVLIAYVEPGGGEALRAAAAAIKAAVDAGRRAWLFTFFSEDAEHAEVSYCALLDDSETAGPAPCRVRELRALVGKIGVHGAAALPDGRRVHVETIALPTTAIICGAGHVAQALAPIAQSAGFQAIVLDDRPEFANRERFPTAARVEVIAGFEEPFRGIDVTENSYIVIVTRGHHHDYAALKAALQTPARYVGLMSSRAKRARIDQALAADAFPADRVAAIRSPIGLRIGAETPAELAVSIVAEMIQARARGA
jgi:xanthine dehydrogenase accessory factor